jgi:hypothetical protein
MVMMFVWGVVSMLDRIRVVFLPQKTSRAGDFCSCPKVFQTQIVVISLTAIDGHVRQFFNELHCSLVTSTIFVRC